MKKISLILFLSCILIPCAYGVLTPAEQQELNELEAEFGGVSDTYQENDVLISFKRAYLQERYRSSEIDYCIELSLKVLAENKIIRPSTRYVLVCIFDNFGNKLGSSSISPTYSG